MEYLAHSAHDGSSEQSYFDHVDRVAQDALKNAEQAAKYAKTTSDAELLMNSVYNAALVHDMGKLNAENQKVLHEADNKRVLPVHHQDAGVAYLKSEDNSYFSQLIVHSHHSGLPNIPSEQIRKENTFFRDDLPKTRELVNRELAELVDCHKSLISKGFKSFKIDKIYSNKAVFSRIALSCLVDADHSDTARHYGKYPIDEEMTELRAEERLEKLNAYIDTKKSDSERNKLRSEMYCSCRDCDLSENIVACDSPVGSGKTTAIMANLLTQAIRRKARRIFVVLPFTNIITQSVQKYREALVLPNEKPENVVAELHHKADFENEDIRALSSNWKAPIIVTTAVAFFETLASNRPAGLRRLHELPGSVIFVDEAHAAVPVKLLPITWRWMKNFADDWSCYWVLASGSLVQFWNITELCNKMRNVPQIVPSELRERLSCFENRRIDYKFRRDRLTADELVDWVLSTAGPRLVIMNTVKSAAVIAKKLRKKCGEDKVLHLSTALNAEDREKTVGTVGEWLKDKNKNDWTLVATSCVEAGMDFSFRTGFREVSSLLSLLQASGRVSRNGEHDDAVMWSFQMREDEAMLSINPAVKDSADILVNYFENGKTISPELSTDSIRREIIISTVADNAKKLINDEKQQCFKEVNDNYHVIESDTVLVVADESVKNSIKYGQCDWKDIQKKAVTLRRENAKHYKLTELAEGIYDWNLGYSPFLGIMEGALNYDALMKCTDTLII